jgi:eukaryotic-like serine/threonine-protein kinase
MRPLADDETRGLRPGSADVHTNLTGQQRRRRPRPGPGPAAQGLGAQAVPGRYLDGLSSALPVTTEGIPGQCGAGWGGVLSEEFPALAGFRAGSLVAGYRLEAQVGAGGFAVVFRARDQRLDRQVALKILAPALSADAAFRRRFIAESRAAAAVADPHVIPVYEAGEADGVLFIAMQFVIGGDLRGVLEREGPLPPDRAVEFLSPVASALDAAHGAGLVHRDVKPGNILVDARPGRPDHVYLSDFGVSKGATSSVSLTGTGVFLGTPDYSAPEQIQGRAVDERTDQYALACVAYQLLAAAVPFERDQGMAVLLAHLSEPPPSLGARRPGLPEAADAVLARGMAKVPEKRYESCRDFADALREALGLAPYHRRGPASAPGHPETQIGSPPAGFPGPAAISPAADEVRTVTKVPLLLASSPAGQAGAGPDVGPVTLPGGYEQRATRPPRDGHPHVAASGLEPGPGGKRLRTRRPGRAIRRRPVSIIALAVAIAVIGLVIATTTISSTPHGSAGTRSSGTPSAHGTPGQVQWTYTTGTHISSGPAVAGGIVYIGSDDGRVHALNAATGQVTWTYATGGGIITSPAMAVAGGTVYIGSAVGTVYALDAVTGQVRWTYTTAGNLVSSTAVAVAGGTVYIASATNKVYALDAVTGHLRWTYTTASYVDSSPAVAGGTAYIASADGTVYALTAVTGHLRWTYPTGGQVESSPAVAGGTVYTGSANAVYALAAATGQVRWTYITGGGVYSSPAVAGGTVYVGGADGKVYALDAFTGHLRWTYTTGGIDYSSPAVAGGTVYVGSEDGKVYALDAVTGHLRWTYTTRGQVVLNPAVAGGTLYIGSEDKVYALTAAG